MVPPFYIVACSADIHTVMSLGQSRHRRRRQGQRLEMQVARDWQLYCQWTLCQASLHLHLHHHQLHLRLLL